MSLLCHCRHFPKIKQLCQRNMVCRFGYKGVFFTLCVVLFKNQNNLMHLLLTIFGKTQCDCPCLFPTIAFLLEWTNLLCWTSLHNLPSWYFNLTFQFHISWHWSQISKSNTNFANNFFQCMYLVLLPLFIKCLVSSSVILKNVCALVSFMNIIRQEWPISGTRATRIPQHHFQWPAKTFRKNLQIWNFVELNIANVSAEAYLKRNFCLFPLKQRLATTGQQSGAGVPAHGEFVTGPCRTKSQLLHKSQFFCLSVENPTFGLRFGFMIPRLFAMLSWHRKNSFSIIRNLCGKNYPKTRIFQVFSKNTLSVLEVRFQVRFQKHFCDAWVITFHIQLKSRESLSE